MKKINHLTLWVFIACSLVIISIVILCPHNKMIDFRGNVKTIEINENGDAYITARFDTANEGSIKIKIPKDIKIEYYKNKKASIHDLELEIMIDADFKSKKEGEYYVAKWVVIYPQSNRTD